MNFSIESVHYSYPHYNRFQPKPVAQNLKWENLKVLMVCTYCCNKSKLTVECVYIVPEFGSNV